MMATHPPIDRATIRAESLARFRAVEARVDRERQLLADKREQIERRIADLRAAIDDLGRQSLQLTQAIQGAGHELDRARAEHESLMRKNEDPRVLAFRAELDQAAERARQGLRAWTERVVVDVSTGKRAAVERTNHAAVQIAIDSVTQARSAALALSYVSADQLDAAIERIRRTLVTVAEAERQPGIGR